jgi:hypothetical protein
MLVCMHGSFWQQELHSIHISQNLCQLSRLSCCIVQARLHALLRLLMLQHGHPRLCCRLRRVLSMEILAGTCRRWLPHRRRRWFGVGAYRRQHYLLREVQPTTRCTKHSESVWVTTSRQRVVLRFYGQVPLSAAQYNAQPSVTQTSNPTTGATHCEPLADRALPSRTSHGYQHWPACRVACH